MRKKSPYRFTDYCKGNFFWKALTGSLFSIIILTSFSYDFFEVKKDSLLTSVSNVYSINAELDNMKSRAYKENVFAAIIDSKYWYKIKYTKNDFWKNEEIIDYR